MFRFEELDIWKRSAVFSGRIAELSEKLPSRERFVIVDQLMRASLSTPTNIAEGCGRASNREFHRFLDIARGSVYESASLVMMCHDRWYVSDAERTELAGEAEAIAKMISTFMRSLR